MSRKPDPSLEARILDAAGELWRKGGGQALSVHGRAGGRYEHARNLSLFSESPGHPAPIGTQDPAATVRGTPSCNSLEEAGRRTFALALAHPREYERIMAGLVSRIKEPQPNFEFVKKRSAEWLGGSPQDYTRLALAVFSAVDGTALLAYEDCPERYGS